MLATASDLLEADDIVVLLGLLLLFDDMCHYINDAIAVLANVKLGSSLFLFKDRGQFALPFANASGQVGLGCVLLRALGERLDVCPAKSLKLARLEIGRICWQMKQ